MWHLPNLLYDPSSCVGADLTNFSGVEVLFISLCDTWRHSWMSGGLFGIQPISPPNISPLSNASKVFVPWPSLSEIPSKCSPDCAASDYLSYIFECSWPSLRALWWVNNVISIRIMALGSNWGYWWCFSEWFTNHIMKGQHVPLPNEKDVSKENSCEWLIRHIYL